AGMIAWAISTIRTYIRYRGQMLFRCPETGETASVHLAAGKAAFGAVKSQATVRLHECSRWPERQGCGQQCLGQLAANPENCLSWTKVAGWYRGRSCVHCHQ